MKTAMKLCLAACLAGTLVRGARATTLLDGFEDTGYTATAAGGESVAFAPAPSHTEGVAGLNITYNFVAHLADIINATIRSGIDLDKI